jgi:hypothetical protein
MESDPSGVSASFVPGNAYADAMARLRAVQDALNAADLGRASALLLEHDRQIRAAFAQVPPALAVSEVESLQNAQSALLDQLEVVRGRVERESQQAHRGGAAARAYLGNAGG